MSKTFYAFLAIVCFCIFTHGTVHAQAYKKGDNLLNAGVGLGVYTYGGLPIGVSFEHGITQEFSVGAFVDYLSWKNGYLTYNYSWRIFYIGARGSYHLNELLKLDNDKVDLYIGAGLGFAVVSTSDKLITGYGGFGNRLFLNAHGGARYYFSNNIAGFAEVGYGVSALKLGLTFKF